MVAPQTIPLAHGKGETIVDADVYEWARHRLWHLEADRYAARCQRDADGARGSVYLHRLVMEAPPGVEVDHINRDSLDNRRCNLRLLTHGQNVQNSTYVRARSGVRGVKWDADRQKWRARIQLNCRTYWLGRFATIEEAAAVVAEARLRLHPYAPVPAEGVQP